VIPLVDLAPWFEGTPAERAAFAQSVDAHLQRVGFLVVTGHGIDRAVFDDARDVRRAFFALDASTKVSYRDEGIAYRGWIPMGDEANAAAYGIDTPPDLKESLAFGPLDVTPELAAEAPRWYFDNLWPAEVKGLRAAVERFMRACGALVDELLAVLATSLGARPEALLDQCRHPMVSANVNRYPARRDLPGAAVAADQFRIGPHFDYGTITVLDRQPGLGGLEVKVDGAWETAPWVDGALTLNTGLLLQRWSNDRWLPNEHRVLAPPAGRPEEELVSLIFFHEPDHDALIAPLPGCYDAANPPRYEPVPAGEHYAGMLDSISTHSS
jgi:isopenicillin N synthase-like dioxygenase